jgi:hypothetical protein
MGFRAFQLSEVKERHLPVRARDPEFPIPIFDIGGRGLQAARGFLLALLDHVIGRSHRGDAAEREEARAAGEALGRNQVGVALHHLDLRRVDAELV